MEGLFLALPPEVVLHRYFQKIPNPAVRQPYNGKQDLDKLEPGLRSLLSNIQDTWNESLRQQQAQGNGRNFHFDYVEATVPNALAFEDNGYCFIAVTIPLIERLWHTCDQLSKSASVTEILRVATTDQQREATLAALFVTQLGFVVYHEYAHHVRGHIFRPDSQTDFWNEIPDISGGGSLKAQAREVDADGMAVYLVLTHLIDGEGRNSALRLLGHSAAQNDAADEVLLSLFILSAGVFFYVSPPSVFDDVTLYSLTHPPHAARMNELMKSVQAWCKQNRPALEAWLTLERFQLLMRAVEEATLEMTRGRNWSEQTEFFSTDLGAEYYRRLEEEFASLMRLTRRATEVATD